MSRLGVCLGLAALAITAQAQPMPQVLISGRIIDANHRPKPGEVVIFTKSPTEYSRVSTDHDGAFTFSAARGAPCSLTLVESTLIMTLEVAEGDAFALGDIVDQGAIHLAGPVKISPVPAGAPAIAALYILYPHLDPDDNFSFAVLHLILRDGKEILPPAEKGQAGVSSPSISSDHSAAGWLVDYANCCTSYPLSLQLTIYRPGMPLRKFHGDGRAIFAWRFLASGKQVAFHQSYPHGEMHGHDELRNVVTGRLLSKWDEDDDKPIPSWTKGLE